MAAGTSPCIAYLQGNAGADTVPLDRALDDWQALMTPAVMAEVRSDPELPSEVSQMLLDLPLTQIPARPLAQGGGVVGQGPGTTPEGAARGCADRAELHRTRHSSAHGPAWAHSQAPVNLDDREYRLGR